MQPEAMPFPAGTTAYAGQRKLGMRRTRWLKQNSAHRDATELDTFISICGVIVRVRCRNAIKNRGVMLERWMRFGQEICSPLVWRGQLFRVPLLDGAFVVLIEFRGPGISLVR